MTNQTMKYCRALVDGRVAAAEYVVASQRMLVEMLRGRGRATLAAETALARYEAVGVLHIPLGDQLRTAYETMALLARGPLVDRFDVGTA